MECDEARERGPGDLGGGRFKRFWQWKRAVEGTNPKTARPRKVLQGCGSADEDR